MKNLIALCSLFLMITCHSQAQVFNVDTLLFNGNTNKYINLVILGDGYTASEQQDFITDATKIRDYLFTKAPWKNYFNYFNVFGIEVVSQESGVSHPGTATDVTEPVFPVSAVNNYFNTSFDCANIHRLIVAQNTNKIYSVLADNVPNYDIVVVLGNSPQYGGSGGAIATISADSQSSETFLHELGHSFAHLADEYYAGDQYFSQGHPNMTNNTDPNTIKWKNWYGTTNIGIYPYGSSGMASSWFKPSTNTCKMEILGVPYCNVCKEAIVESIHNDVNPIVTYTPTSLTINSAAQNLNFKLTKLMLPIPNTLKITWKLDNTTIKKNEDSVQIDQQTLSPGQHTLVAVVTDTTAMVRVDNHASIHSSSVTWTINAQTNGIAIQSQKDKISYVAFPNPTTDDLTINLTLSKISPVSLWLVDMGGKKIKEIIKNEKMNGKVTKHTTISTLKKGVYTLIFKVNGIRYTKKIVKL